MTKDEALKLALEALENAIAVRHGAGGTKLFDPLEKNAITAIKEALAQPVQLVTWTGNGSAEPRNIEAPRGYFFQVDRRLKEDDDIPWVGLTDAERESIANSTIRIHGQEWAYATAIEAKLKEKNT